MINRRVTKSGPRFEVRLRGPDGVERSKTFRTRRDAERYERDERTRIDRGTWIDPRRSRTPLGEYAATWLAQRKLRPQTRLNYENVLSRHVLPTFGDRPISKIAPSEVRAWYTQLPAQAPKAYRLLHAILNTALRDELIARNPCQVENASADRSEERPVATIPEVTRVVEAMPPRLRAAVLLASWCSMRRGEIIGLERRDIDLRQGMISIERSATWARGGLLIGPPKTRAGYRRIAIPSNILGQIEEHLARYVCPEPSAPLITNESGTRLRPGTLNTAWNEARMTIGREDLRFHDLRHSGATWVAIAGATTKELMHRVGHSSPAAALRYQHATQDRDVIVARALAELGVAANGNPGISRDIRGMEPSEPVWPEGPKALLNREDTLQSQRDSNPCLHLERVMS